MSERNSSHRGERQKYFNVYFKKLFNETEFNAKGQALKIIHAYLSVGCLWVLLSDEFVGYVFMHRSSILLISIVKGLIFVIFTSVLGYWLVYNALKKAIDSKDRMKMANDELEKSNMLFKAILESSPEVIVFALDNEYCYTAFNQRHKDTMLQIWGKEISTGMNILDVIGTDEDRYKAQENFDRALTGKSFSLVEEYGDETLSRLYWQNYYSPIISDDGKIVGMTCFVLNITALKIAKEENEYLSYHDKLTGLYNRKFYVETLKQTDVPRNLPISIIMGDVNGLKLVNDAFGQQMGDELLKLSAAAIINACDSDDIIARWGGDEFIILLPKTSAKEAEAVVSRIKEQCADKQVNAIHVELSFGCATKENADEELGDIIKNAEDSMFKHKMVESKSIRSHIIKTIMNTLHEKNPREEAHSKRVGEISRKIGMAMCIPDIDVRTLNLAGFLHDIGKIGIEEGILNKPGVLTVPELDLIKQHPEIGYRIIKSSYGISEIAVAILAHHERWDGTGYPNGLKGEEIPKFARIIAIADSYDAMTSERPYQIVMTTEEAIRIIKKNAGIQFDPIIAEIFVEQVFNCKWDSYS